MRNIYCIMICMTITNHISVFQLAQIQPVFQKLFYRHYMRSQHLKCILIKPFRQRSKLVTFSPPPLRIQATTYSFDCLKSACCCGEVLTCTWKSTEGLSRAVHHNDRSNKAHLHCFAGTVAGWKRTQKYCKPIREHFTLEGNSSLLGSSPCSKKRLISVEH